MKTAVLFLLASSVVASAQQYTRGLGVYPGDPKQYDGPSLVVDATTYRNLALHRPAYQSSAYDYNLTAQLATDGIKETAPPLWVVTSTSDRGVLPKAEREAFLDEGVVSSVDVAGEHPWVQFDVKGAQPPEIDHMDVVLRKIYAAAPQGGWTIVVAGSDDGAAWNEVGRFTGIDFPGSHDSEPSFTVPVVFPAAVHYRSYRLTFSAPNVKKWGVADVDPSYKGRRVYVAGPQVFTSAWMSAGEGEEWVSVDLGAPCTFDRVALTWVKRAAEGSIQVSDDGVKWQTLQALNGNDDVRLASAAHGRWVRVLMTKPAEAGGHYILSELEVYGRGGPVARAQAAVAAGNDGSLTLTRGAWRVERASQVTATGEQLSEAGFADASWMVATVPGTVLTSYLNDGAIADPNFGENQYVVSDSYFTADFWYRDEFTAPALAVGRHAWLNFDGVNWKAEVYLNGQRLGAIDGGFMRGKFDVTSLLHPGAKNALAVRVLRNAHPGGTKDKEGDSPNGGALGLDNPTYHASIGWDWMPTIRGRNTGIWSNVMLTQTGAVTIENPLVTTTLQLPDTSHADVTIAARLSNEEGKTVAGTLRVKFGDITVEQPVTLEGGAKTVTLSPETNPQLRISNPKLWWPNGYGDPNLYPVTISFVADGKVSDTTSFKAGIRQFTYSEEGGALKMWINGRRFIARGGNWGFPESMLRYRQREYDIAMRYHRDQHFNMLRNWVGQTGDEALYDAADRYGIVVWQDFWLANPWDGPNPENNAFFLAGARDYVLKIRNHASVGLYCGRNEGFPPKFLDDGLRSMVAELEPNSHYISSSADGPVEGRGPYRVEPLRYYFEHTPPKFHSEIGAPNVPEMAIMQRTLDEKGMWPVGPEWRLHDFYPDNPFETAVEKDFGGAKSAAEFVELAQFVDYNAYRGMFEGQSKNRPGVLIWMSHPAWPSILWQTYDYFFDTDAAYFAAKHASEPLHIQWNAAADTLEVVNYNAGDQTGLTARAEVIDIDGKTKWQQSANLDSKEDSTESPLKMQYPAGLARTHFIRLTLLKGDKVLSTNFYLHGNAEEDYAGIRGLAAAKVEMKTHITQTGSTWHVTAELHNASATPALMVRVKVVREKSGDLIAPALYDDNYVALMPGEKRNIQVTFEDADTRGEKPRVVMEGFNLEAARH
ncbi:glycosyl hydrolase 2 galactose-binding domain-containing protein [Occallatibacter riparius]|uniref:Discoidin domain-containing protein n=1 Tax=Occallatibacter riparius TaxID=1002689 RepID=A0A9J7BN36_9BACT|nr:discoidin domain-containing protein [Occallatibacter riparius]UWZ84107.1 discoidin domain-containing protein [Occallatibacter riparius]